jgi:hypothetical protein
MAAMLRVGGASKNTDLVHISDGSVKGVMKLAPESTGDQAAVEFTQSSQPIQKTFKEPASCWRRNIPPGNPQLEECNAFFYPPSHHLLASGCFNRNFLSTLWPVA